jgi:hypothetical protein
MSEKTDKPKLVLDRPGTTPAERVEAAIRLYRELTGKEPTPEELARLRVRYGIVDPAKEGGGA